jgi:hypothetical protein
MPQMILKVIVEILNCSPGISSTVAFPCVERMVRDRVFSFLITGTQSVRSFGHACVISGMLAAWTSAEVDGLSGDVYVRAEARKNHWVVCGFVQVESLDFKVACSRLAADAAVAVAASAAAAAAASEACSR